MKRAKKIDKIVVATTTNKGRAGDGDERKIGGRRGFLGSEENVLERYYQCAKKRELRRLCGSQEIARLIDPVLIDEAVTLSRGRSKACLSIIFQMETFTYPRGMDTEVFTFAALEKAY